MPSPAINTYVLLGSGYDSKYSEIEKFYLAEHCHVIKPRPGETAEQIAAQIKPPANVIVHCHGINDKSGNITDKFEWNGGQGIQYEHMFGLLPRRGIGSIVLAVCEGTGGVSAAALRAAPPGTLVQSLVSPSNVITFGTYAKFADEASGVTRPATLFLEALDNFSPDYYRRSVDAQNAKLPAGQRKYDSDPAHALPSSLYVAGREPRRIDLNFEMRDIIGSPASLNRPALQRAVARVKDRFDTAVPALSPTGSRVYQPDNPAGDQQLYRRVDAVLANMLQNRPPQTVDERRIANAITVAYMDESGRLQAYLEHAIPRDAFGAVIQPGQVSHKPGSPITADENAYIGSIQHKLAHNPQLSQIVAAVTRTFSQSNANDMFPAGGSLDHTLNQAGVSTRSWTR